MPWSTPVFKTHCPFSLLLSSCTHHYSTVQRVVVVYCMWRLLDRASMKVTAWALFLCCRAALPSRSWYLCSQGKQRGGSGAGWRVNAAYLVWTWMCCDFPGQRTSSCKLTLGAFHILVLLSDVTSFSLELDIPRWTCTFYRPPGKWMPLSVCKGLQRFY